MDQLSTVRIRSSEELTDEDIDRIILSALSPTRPRRVKWIMTYMEKVLQMHIENPNRLSGRINRRLRKMIEQGIVSRKENENRYRLLY